MKGQKMTATERKRRERQRRREAGFVEVKLWALPQHHAAIKAFARALVDPVAASVYPVAASTCTDPVAGKVPLAVSVDPVAVNTTGG
jgi:hypothetical protein